MQKFNNENIQWSTVCMCMLSHISHIWLSDAMDCSWPDSSVHEILQSKILQWVAMFSSRGSSQPRGWTHVCCGSCIAGEFFTTEPPGKPEAPFTAGQKLNSCVCPRCLRNTGGALPLMSEQHVKLGVPRVSDEAEVHGWEDIYHVFSTTAIYELMCRLLYYYKFMCIYIYIYTHTHIHTYMYTHTHTLTHMHVFYFI